MATIQRARGPSWELARDIIVASRSGASDAEFESAVDSVLVASRDGDTRCKIAADQDLFKALTKAYVSADVPERELRKLRCIGNLVADNGIQWIAIHMVLLITLELREK